MEENKKGMTTPQWVKDAADWQKADDDNRSMLIIVAEGSNGISGIGGDSILLVNTIVAALGRDPGIEKCFKDAMRVSNDPMAAMAFGVELNNFMKKKGYGQKQDGSEGMP